MSENIVIALIAFAGTLLGSYIPQKTKQQVVLIGGKRLQYK
jgi:hypothetical protein